MSDKKNDFVFTGKIVKIFEEKTGTGANGDWKVIEFLVEETSDTYPQSAVFKMFGVEKVEKFVQYNKVGKLVDVHFNLKSNVGGADGRVFNNLDAWKVFTAKEDETGTTPPPVDDGEPDDLPF